MEPVLSNILPAILWALLLSAAARYLPVFGRDMPVRMRFFGLFWLKLAVGTAVWAIYTYYYTDRQTSDIYRFFADAEVVYHTLSTHPRTYLHLVTGIGGHAADLQPYLDAMNNWYKSFDDGFVNENRTLIRVNALLMPLTAGSYFGNMVIVCFVGVWAQAYLYAGLTRRFTGPPLLLFAAVNLWPSQLFWTSALMKEPLVMTGLAVTVGAALRLKTKPFSAAAALLLAGGMLLTLFSKFYVGVALLFPVAAFLVVRDGAPVLQLAASYAGMTALLFLCAWGLGRVAPAYDIPTIIAAKQHAFTNVAEATKAGSAFYITPLEPSLGHMIQLSPTGIVNSLLRPFPGDAEGMMEWAAVAENLLFLGIAGLLLLNMKRGSMQRNPAAALLVFGLIILVLGGITVNISGALVRYKMPAVPYLTLALLLVSRFNTPVREART